MSLPICTVVGITNIISASVVESHGSPTAVATIEAESTTLEIGDEISVVMGDEVSSGSVFTGYVKQIEAKSPFTSVSITANDKMTRAVDYFVAPSDPNNTYKRSAIQTETLIVDLMAMAGLSSIDCDTTYFQLASTGELEVNLVSVYDYCKGLSDLLTWTLWCDRDGVIHFRNRKPFLMYGTSGQVGDNVADSVDPLKPEDSIFSAEVINLSSKVDEKNLRNRIVVYGSGCQAEASLASPYLPGGFYKTAVVGAQLMLDTQAGCQQTADYNLQLYNRLTNSASCVVAGKNYQWKLQAREVTSLVVHDKYPAIADNTMYYIYSAEHTFSSAGYTTTLDLRI
jgi:hypothetical protein